MNNEINLKKVIINVEKKDSDVQDTTVKCYSCNEIFKIGEEVLLCPVCDEYIHQDCVHDHNKCHIPDYKFITYDGKNL